MRFLAVIKDKTITFGNLIYARHHLGKLEGKTVIVTVEKQHNKRSLNQNKYYWLCLGIIADYTGHDSDELHTIYKSRFLPPKEIRLNGVRYLVPGSTTDLTKGQFVEYIMKITADAAQTGLKLPTPEEYQRGLDMSFLSTE